MGEDLEDVEVVSQSVSGHQEHPCNGHRGGFIQGPRPRRRHGVQQLPFYSNNARSASASDKSDPSFFAQRRSISQINNK